MINFNEELLSLRQKIFEKPHVEAKLADLKKQLYGLEDNVRILKIKKEYEQEDVDRLEGRSLTAFFYTVVGKKDEKLDKERQEALAAAMKYDTAARELEYVQREIRRCEDELKTLSEQEETYEKLLKEKASLIKSAEKAESVEIIGLEEKIAVQEGRKKELIEAIGAGDRARETAKSVSEKLKNAENWGTYDLLGGGIVSDIAKHGALDEAQSLIEELQIELRSFKTELADVELNSEIQLETGGFIRFADYFFDGLVADWTVLKRINKAQEKVDEVLKSLDKTIGILGDMYYETDEAMIELKDKLDELVTDTDF